MYEKELKIALQAARSASRVLEKGFRFGAKRILKNKRSDGVSDIVTKYDYQAQRTILRLLRRHFPTHNVLSEEGISIIQKSPYQWLIDPLDGTNNFSRGIPNFAVSIALEKNGKLVLGVVALPAEKNIYWAAHQQGAFLNGKRITVGTNQKIHSALVGLSMLRSKEALLLGTKTFGKLMRVPIKPRVFGSIASDLARVAAGKLDAVVFNHSMPWDIAAGIILVREAGGRVSPIGHQKFSLDANQWVASNRALHQPLLKILK